MIKKYNKGILRHNGNEPKGGFTLIELMVVMGVIAIVLSMTWIFIAAMRNDSLKEAGGLVKWTFMRASQLASSQRMTYYILFQKDITIGADTYKTTMSIFQECNDDNNTFDTADKQVGPSVTLPKGVYFWHDSDGKGEPPLFTPPYLFQSQEPAIGFNSNGTLMATNDLEFNPDSKTATADIILAQQGSPARMYLDFSVTTGRIINMDYEQNGE